MTDDKRALIRNSIVEFRNLTGRAGEQSIDARYEGESDLLPGKRGGRI